MTSEDAETITSVGRTFDILEGLKKLDQAGVTEVAETVGLPPSTVYNYLQSLKERKYVVKEGQKYRLANRFTHLGDYIKHNQKLFRTGRKNINHLIEKTGKIANLIVEEYGRGIYVISKTPESGLRNYSHVRRREYLHSTAAGKAILLSMPDKRIEEILESEGLPERTEQTITDESALFEHLSKAEERGYTWSSEENTEGIRAVGAPIKNPDGSFAAVSVAGPVNRISEEQLHGELSTAVTNTAKSINLELRS